MSVQAANLLDLPLEIRAEMAMKEAVDEVMEDHIRSGRPIHIWRDGRVVEVSADELRAQRTPSQSLTPST
jgi:hypothetical protein